MLSSENGISHLGEAWWAALKSEFEQPYMQQLDAFLQAEKEAGKEIFPSENNRFRAFRETPLDQVKVVIIGQDPYPTPGDAHGLSFSVENPEQALPKSLINIFKELQDDLGIDNRTGNLTAWARQGVLLLNAVLSVEKGKMGSHQNKGWETFTDRAVDVLNARQAPLVFVLWGAYAQKKGARIDAQKHHVIRSPHPSPLAAYRGFWGSKPFSRTNAQLEAWGQTPIDWRL